MICKMSNNFWVGDGYSSIRDSVAFVVTNPARARASSCQWVRSLPGSHVRGAGGTLIAVRGKGTGTGPTRQIASR
jgi:hypothetical protein